VEPRGEVALEKRLAQLEAAILALTEAYTRLEAKLREGGGFPSLPPAQSASPPSPSPPQPQPPLPPELLGILLQRFVGGGESSGLEKALVANALQSALEGVVFDRLFRRRIIAAFGKEALAEFERITQSMMRGGEE
jgi:hypothetical protein